MSVNKLILKQLEKVETAKVSEYDELHHTFHITKYEEKKFEQNLFYIIKLDKNLLNGNDNSLLVSNWNNGKYPTQEYLKVAITKQVANMIYVYGMYYNIESKQQLDEEWVGWLPIDQIEIVEVSNI